MNTLILLSAVVLLLAAIYFHGIAQANVITKIESEWFERLFTGSRASKNNLTEEGLRYRKRSNLCLAVGLVLIVVYLFLPSAVNP